MARLSSGRSKGPRLPYKLLTGKETDVASKRRDPKGKGKVRMNADVYDYEPEKVRRGNVKLTLDDDEMRGAGYGSESEDDNGGEGSSRRSPRLIGDDEELGSEDEDEEIDSDDAFGESDEERFAGYSFKKKKKPSTKKSQGSVKVKRVEVDLNEDEDMEKDEQMSEGIHEQSSDSDEEEEGSGDEDFYDILDILDGRAKIPAEEADTRSDSKQDASKSDPHANGIGESSREGSDPGAGEDDSSDTSEDKSEDEIIISGSEDERDDEALDNLHTIVNGLETGTKRKSIDDVEGGQKAFIKKRKRILKDVAESGVENEFGGNVGDGSKLSLDDLLAPLSSKKAHLDSLKAAMKPLTSSSLKNQPLTAPLPLRTQEKLDREAAYEQTKQEVDKWTSTMKRIHEAEHLSFPLQAPEVTRTSNLELTAKFKPVTELESSIDRLLKQAKLRDEDLNKTEELLMKDLSVEEVAERRAELRKMRELAFRADQKAKRVAKIKSKAYRRIQKKEKAKLLAKLDASGERTAEDLEEERLKAEVDRARERATLRHKNTGKWAKAMKDRGELDEDQRRDINEMLDKGERLRRRIQGVGSGSEGEDDSGTDSDADVDRIRENAFNELKALKDNDGDGTESSQKAKSVFQMKFMKDAAARQNVALDRDIDDFKRAMGGTESDQDGNSANGEPPQPQRSNGRLVFQPGANVSGQMLPPPPPSAISETSTMRSHDSLVKSPIAGLSKDVSPPAPASTLSSGTNAREVENPWLVESSGSTKVAKRKNELVSGKNLTRSEKSESQMKRQLRRGTEERERQIEDATVVLDADDVLTLSRKAEVAEDKKGGGQSIPLTPSRKQKKKGARKAKQENKEQQAKLNPVVAGSIDDEDEDDANSEVEAQEASLRKGRKPTAFEQRDLIAKAFAGDNVIQQFEEEKRKEMEADAPHEVDMSLAGWGSWGGQGTKKAPPKPYLMKKVAGIVPQSRADYGKAHVIISEKRDKKALKYAVKDLPYPYTSKAQFEAKMSTPIGSEWNTRLGFQRGTLPRVVKKMGTIIDPLEKL